MTRVYCRCNGGDYFLGEFCPFDGWASPESRAIADAARRLEEAGIPPSIQSLREAGLGEAALARAVVIEFGAAESAFEALTPKLLVVGGQVRQPKDLNLNFM
jgi:hypothetical protein